MEVELEQDTHKEIEGLRANVGLQSTDDVNAVDSLIRVPKVLLTDAGAFWLHRGMATQFQTRSTPARKGQALRWMQARMPDRYWEPQDSARFLQLYDADVSFPAETATWAPTRMGIAVARLIDLDREIDRLIREFGIPAPEPEMTLADASITDTSFLDELVSD